MEALDQNRLDQLKECSIQGGTLSLESLYWLANAAPKQALYEAAEQITKSCARDGFDLCSILNAKSGRCSEDCKWCAQSAHYQTQAAVYPLVESDKAVTYALFNEKRGVGRFSLVTSGKKPRAEELEQICELYRAIGSQSPIYLCASLGLLSLTELQKLKESGVQRYHCNLETAPSYFKTLCTTHTSEQKVETIKAARAVGMEICSGGIIGMGETMEHRIEWALALRELDVMSIPINVLQPIAGTPLESATPLTQEQLLTTIAILRFIHPKARLRWAGGRALWGRSTQQMAIRIGVDAMIAGDMLTTTGSEFEQDMEMIAPFRNRKL